MIEVSGLTKRYGATLAVDALSFRVRPDAGRATVAGRPYRELDWPLRHVGSLLETKAFHPGRTARAHLAALAASNAIPRRRVDEVLATVGLAGAAGRRVGGFSLGMAQ